MITKADIENRIKEIDTESAQFKIDAEKQLFGYAVVKGELEKLLSSFDQLETKE